MGTPEVVVPGFLAGRALRVRNTFIDTSAERSPSLERFYQEREVHTCPSSCIGMLKEILRDMDDDDTRDEDSLGSLETCDTEGAARHPCATEMDEVEALLMSDSLASLADPLAPPRHSEMPSAGLRLPAAHRPILSLADVLAAPNAALHGAAADGLACAAGYMVPSAIGHPEVAYGCETPMLMMPCAAFSMVGQGVALPTPGSPELPSVGSAGHATGQCKPCAFVHTSGCGNGLACPFCHLCDPGEKKKRRKEKLESRRCARKGKQAISLV